MDNLWDLTGKKALVVGHEGQLGPIWLQTLSEAGADIYAIGLPSCDVTFREEVLEMARKVGPVDIIIYNAAIDNPPNEDERNGWDMFRNYEKITTVNQFGAINVCRAFLVDNIIVKCQKCGHIEIINTENTGGFVAPVCEQCGRENFVVEAIPTGMVSNGGGSIHFIGSIMGYGPPDETNYPETGNGVWTKPLAYGASKRAYLNFAQWITKKFGKDGIRATVPAFGPIDLGKLPPDFIDKISGKIPTRRFTNIDDLKRTLLFNVCCTNFAGQDTLVDGGYRER